MYCLTIVQQISPKQMLKFKNRDADNGSFFYYRKQSIDPALFEQISSQSKIVKPTLEAIFSAKELVDDECTVSTSVIAQRLGLSVKAMNDRIRVLRKLELITDVPFAFIGEHRTKRRVLCLVFSISEPLIFKANESLSGSTKDMSALAKKRHSTKKACKALALTERPDVKNKLPQVLRQSDIFLMEQLAISGKDPRNPLAKTFFVTADDGKAVPVLAKIQSFSRILNSDDLQVLFAAYTLIYLYHEKAMLEHLVNGTRPKNLTPIYVDDILRVQQKGLGGESRKPVRESFKAIRDTEYDLYGLTNIQINNDVVSKYAERRYRNFTQCSALSDVAPEVTSDGGNVVFGDNAMIYLVELPDHIFDSLLYNKTLFVFPTASLSVSSIIFMLYLRLRSKCRHTHDDTLQNLNSVLSPSRRLSDFKKSLIAAMKKLNRFEDAYLFANYRKDEDDIVFNLWGYHGKISLKENYLTVKANQKEVIKACGLDSSKQNSPTKRNDIMDFAPLLQVDKALPKNLQRIIPKDATKYTVQYHHPSVKGSSKTLTAYSTPFEIAQAVDMLCDVYGLDASLVEDKVNQDIECLSKFTVNDHEITYEDYVTLKLTVDAQSLSGEGLIRAFFRKTSMFDELYSVVVQDAEPSRSFCEHVKSFQ